MKNREKSYLSLKAVASLLLAIAFLSSGMPLMTDSQHIGTRVSSPNTLDRYNEPVIIEGSQIPDFNGFSNANIFVWAYKNGWEQVVFQIDEVNGLWPYGNIHKKYEADDGLMDADDEICFMSQDAGDQVDSSQWAPGADTDKPRYEITVSDPNTGNTGWVYLFYHSTPPTWTSESYVSWDQGGNSLTANNYTMDYPDDDAHNTYFHDLRVTPNGGGDNGQFIDREKFYSKWVAWGFITNDICEQTWTSQWSGTDDDGYTSENGLTVGPVRIIRHWRICYAPAQSTEWGEKVSFQVFYYNSMVTKLEHGRFWGSTDHRDDRYSIDHVLTSPASSYWDGNGNSATIDGTTTGDNFGNTAPLDWYQVSSPHGSYVMTAERTFSSGTPAVNSHWIDNSGASDTDGGRSGASSGKFGDVAMHRMDIASETTVWDMEYNMYLLPASISNQGANYNNRASNPISTSDVPPVSQTLSDEVQPPATSNVLVDGLATCSVPYSSAGAVTLTALVSDTGRGDSTIASANYTMGFSNLPGTPTTASDGSFDEVVEEVEAVIDISSWPAGIYDIYVYGTDSKANQNTTSTEHATIEIIDDMAPATVAGSVLVEGTSAYSTLLSNAVPVQIVATIDDAGLGDSNISSAVWTSGHANFPGYAMSPSDGTFDSVSEEVFDTLDIGNWDAGTYSLYVYGTDAEGQQNTISQENATVEVIDDVPPGINNVLVEGNDTFIVPLSDANNVTISALVNDDQSGGTVIGGANLTIGAGNWGTSQTMESEDTLDTDVEGFFKILDISGWLPGTYKVYVHGWDGLDNFNSTGDFITIIITDDASPEIRDVKLDGTDVLYMPFSARNSVTLTGTVDDTGHGDDVIAGANYTIGQANWPGTLMDPFDILDEATENFTSTMDIASWPVGSWDFYLYGWDVMNDCNTSSTAYATLNIFDDSGPSVENFLVNGNLTWETTLSNASTITLTGSVNDSHSGDTVIGGANFTVGLENWPGTAMTPNDALDSSVENFTGVLDISSWDSGIYELYMHGWDEELNVNPDAPPSVTVVIHDDQAPEITDVLINGSATFSVGNADAKEIVLTATLDDVDHGSSNIAGANFTAGFAQWPSSQGMSPADGTFDSPVETATATVDISNWAPGTYTLYVYGWDDSGIFNVTSTAHATLTITDTLPPKIFNFLVNGGKSADVKLSQNATFSGTADDSETGGSNILFGIFTDGEREWNDTYEFESVTALDSPVEEFTRTLDFSTWTSGKHNLYMYASDRLNNHNITSNENVTVNVLDDKAPSTGWSATLNGFSSLSIDFGHPYPVHLNATIDDSLRGFSRIASANYSVGEGNWSGSSLSASDGSFDHYIENVTTALDISDWQVGSYKFLVYGTDEYGNGNTTASEYAVLHIEGKGPDCVDPLADGDNPCNFISDDEVKITAYGDDRENGNNIVTGAEYFVDSPGDNGTGTPMSNTGFRFDSAYEGVKAFIDTSKWYAGESHLYYIHFQDESGLWGEYGVVQVTKETSLNISFHQGWNLMSIPLMKEGGISLEEAFADEWDNVQSIMHYDSQTKKWQMYHEDSPTWLNSLLSIDETMGVWVKFKTSGDGNLTLTGGFPSSTDIHLEPGWNLVGYPSDTPRQVSDILAGTGYDLIQGHDPGAPYLIADMSDADTVSIGQGVWVHVPAETAYTVYW